MLFYVSTGADAYLGPVFTDDEDLEFKLNQVGYVKFSDDGNKIQMYNPEAHEEKVYKIEIPVVESDETTWTRS